MKGDIHSSVWTLRKLTDKLYFGAVNKTEPLRPSFALLRDPSMSPRPNQPPSGAAVPIRR